MKIMERLFPPLIQHRHGWTFEPQALVNTVIMPEISVFMLETCMPMQGKDLFLMADMGRIAFVQVFPVMEVMAAPLCLTLTYVHIVILHVAVVVSVMILIPPQQTITVPLSVLALLVIPVILKWITLPTNIFIHTISRLLLGT